MKKNHNNDLEENHNVNDENMNDEIFPKLDVPTEYVEGSNTLRIDLSNLGRDYVLWRLGRIDEKLDLLTEIAIRLQSRLEIIADGSQFQCDFFPGEGDQDA